MEGETPKVKVLSMGEPEPAIEPTYMVNMTILCREHNNAHRIAMMVTNIMAMLQVPGMVTVIEHKGPVEVPPVS